MLSASTRLAVASLVFAFAGAVVSPAQANCVAPSVAVESDLTVELARGAIGAARCAEIYAPTGETVDMVLEVTASRLP